MAGDGVAVIEMAMLGGCELDQPVVVGPGADASIRRAGFDDGKIAVGDVERSIGSGELNAVANRKLMGGLAVDADAGKPAWIVGGNCAGLHFDSEQVLALNENAKAVILGGNCAAGFQLLTHRQIQFAAGGVVGRHDQRVRW